MQMNTKTWSSSSSRTNGATSGRSLHHEYDPLFYMIPPTTGRQQPFTTFAPTNLLGTMAGPSKQPESHDKVVIDIPKIEESMVKSINTIGKFYKQNGFCTIHKVFHSVRSKHEIDYTPKVIAIGPFHHHNDALKPMEELKWTYLRSLIFSDNTINKLNKYITLIAEQEKWVRSFYSEPVVEDDNAFVELMVLDGCFLIQYLVKAYIADHEPRLSHVKRNLSLLWHDMLLLENQYPYPVLQKLFNASNIPILSEIKENGSPVTLMNLIVSFVTKNTMETLPEAKNQEESSNPRSINHLLHAYHASLCLPPSSSKAKYGRIRSKLVRSGNMINSTIFYILSCFCCRFHFPWMCCRSNKNDPRKKEKAPKSIPTATQLQDRGITFKKKKIENKPTPPNMLDVSFHEDSGIIEMTELSIHDYTSSLLHNLIAFEQCTPTTGTYFASHGTFMSNLIDKAEDVAVLKESHVIESKLSNEEVADHFNHFYEGAYLDYESHHHIQIFKDINKYCGVAHHKWRASLCRDYFGNPWVIISVLAAVFLLLLTVLQSVYTVYPYYHPRN